MLICAWGKESPPPVRIAVLYFENNSSNKPKLKPLSKGLCDMMISDIKKTPKLNVVERTRLEQVIKELKMTRSAAFDAKSTVQLGKLLGVEYLIFGSFFNLFGKFRIDARVVKVETGEISLAVSVSGKQEDFDTLEQKLVQKILNKLFPEKKSRLYTKKQTVSQKVTLRGAIKYGDALGKMDKGDTKGATALLKDIVESNPDFELARQLLSSTKGKK